MKRKTELTKQIKNFYDLKKQAREVMRQSELPLSRLQEPFQIFDYCILTLKWVLGYKVKYKGSHYWCFSCHIMHSDLACPKCGGNRVMNDSTQSE